MSNKETLKLNGIDQVLRSLFPPAPTPEKKVQFTIEKICGYELFNTRPYHNFETYSDGYRALINGRVICEDEDLDDLINTLAKLKCMRCHDFHSSRIQCGDIK
jgi:hypothetical protein